MFKSSPLFAAERQNRIMQIIASQGRVSAAELQQSLGISVSTVRRDLNELEAAGRLHRTHGGAVGLAAVTADPAFAARQPMNAAAKARIGRAAAAMIRSDEVVFVDSGTTARQVLHLLLDRDDVRVVTNAANAWELAQHCSEGKLYVTGGWFRPVNLCYVGPDAIEAINRHCFTTAVLGCYAVDLERGLIATPAPEEAALQRAVIRRASRVIVVADRSKIGRESGAVIASLDAVTALVTDDPGASGLEVLIREGIRIVTE